MLNALNTKGKMFRAALFFVLLFLVITQAEAQEPLPAVRISVDVRNGTLAELLSRITDASGVTFSYNPRRIPSGRKLSYTADKESLSDVLRFISAEFGLVYEVVEGQIILKPEKGKGKVGAFTISGTIRDADSGEALIGASVFVQELQTGTITNPFGFYSLTIPKGSYKISFSFVGYQEVNRTFDLSGPVKEDLRLVEAAPMLEEVVVSSIPSVASQMLTSNTDIRPASVEERPEFLGEMDVVKTLESIPGVKFHSDGSTFYYVRGGHRDQNLILIDDAPVYNPSHMLGIFSTLIPDAVNNITMYKGDMPPSFGGRLSSVLDVRTKKGNDQHFQAWGSLGLISTKLGVEGPIRKNASSYLLSGRFSTMKWFFQRLGEDIKRFDFHDLTGKVNVRLHTNNRVFFSFYTGADNYFGGNHGIAWSNNAATLQWNRLINDRLFLNTTLAAGGYDYFLHTNVANGTKWNSHISNFNIKTDFNYFVSPQQEITFGAGVNGYAFNPGNLESNVNIGTLPLLSVRNSVELVAYGSHEIRTGNKFGVNYGIRFTSWSNRGEAFEYVFDENRLPIDTLFFKPGESYKTFLRAEPRITFNYFISDERSLKASFSRNIQHVHLISNSVSPFTSLDIWVPSSFNIRPQTANQVTMGYYHSLPRRSISFSGEAFLKRMFNQIDYDVHAEILLNPFFERELRFGRARAYGFELLAKKDEGRIHGWIGYSWSRVKRRFPEINSGKQYNAFNDRPHQINLTAMYDLSPRWKFGTNWNYATGSPYTSPVSFYSYNGEEVPVYGHKNNSRLPDYHRLDVSATYRLNKNPERKYTHNVSFSVFNFYGRKNALFVNYNKVETGDGSLKVPSDLVSAERVTSRYYLFGFTPSLSYNFKWL